MNQNIRALQADLGFSGKDIDGRRGSKTDAAILAAADQGRLIVAATVTVAAKPAQAAMIYQGAARHPVREIIVHCSATQPDWMADRPIAEKVAEIRRWHRANGWNDIGYHWIIDRDGKVLAGRPETVIGAHAVGHNAGTIGICLIGGHGSAETDRFVYHFTSQQDITLRQMIDAISLRTSITRITGHNEYAAKACPGFRVSDWLKGA